MQNGNKIGKAFVMIFQISISMIVPMAMCGTAGFYLDRKFKTGFLFILLLFLGILASFRNVYYLTREFYKKDMEQEHAKLAYIENLKKEGRKVREAADQEKETSGQDKR